MDIDALNGIVTSFISSVGFPIAAFVMMWRLHNTESKGWRETLEHNTEALAELTKAIRKEE